MSGSGGRILVYGYGNPGRRDDGLGPAFVRDLAARVPHGATYASAYQLQIEDAALVAEHGTVVFVDAELDGTGPSGTEAFRLREIEPRRDAAFTTHAMAPEAVLALAHEHFACATSGLVLGIRGYEFGDYGEGLSVRARENLAAAVDALERWLLERSLADPAVRAGREG